jgi:hypothetical protein
VAKRTPENNRRRLIEEQRKKAHSSERRTTVMVIVVSSLVGIALIASAVFIGRDDPKNQALRTIGVAAEAAGCAEAKEEPIPDEAKDDAVKHTPRNGDRVEYTIIPPTSGRHNPTPLPVGAKKFYSRDENPPPERAVHNLEHGYIVVWYDNKATDAQVQLLEDAADAAEGKFLIMPWTRADFPDDKHVVLTSWARKQQCTDVSGAVFQDFVDKYGGRNSIAPEKGAI